MYELYDKNGKFICYRMTKRIRNEHGEYDVLTARSKKSEKDCKRVMDEKSVITMFKKRKKSTREFIPICFSKTSQIIGTSLM